MRHPHKKRVLAYYARGFTRDRAFELALGDAGQFGYFFGHKVDTRMVNTIWRHILEVYKESDV